MVKKSATLKDVAREVGVSLMTVSMSLRDHPRISEVTRARVKAAAVKLGYRPNPDAQLLMERVRAHKARVYEPTIAVLQFEGWVQPDYYTAAILNGAAARADEIGYKLERFPVLGKGMTLSRLMVVLRTRNITGLMIPPLASGRAHLRLNWAQFAAVSTTGSLWRPRISATTPDFFYNGCLAFREVRRMGYRRVGLLLPKASEDRSRHAFSAAYYWHCQSEGIRTPPRVLIGGEEAEIVRWAKSGRFDAIVGNDYFEYNILKRLGIVPATPYACLAWRPSHPHVPGVDLQPEKIGSAALDVVDAALRRNELGIPANPKTITIEGRWVKGTA